MTDLISRYQLPMDTHHAIKQVVTTYFDNIANTPRLQLKLADLSKEIDYSSPHAESIVSGLREFELGRMTLSVNSQKVLNSTLRSYVRFCRAMDVKALPLEPMTLLAYYITLDTSGKSFNTIKQHIAQLSKLAVITNSPNHNKHAIIQGLVTSIEERMAAESDPRLKPNQAPPLHHYHVEELVKLWGNSKRAIHIRDLAAIILAYGTSLRKEEICRIRIEDLVFNPEGFLTVNRRLSKTQKRDLAPKAISGQLAEVILKLVALFDLPSHNEMVLFSKVSPKGESLLPSTQPMTSKGINAVFERAYLALHPEMKAHKEALIAERGRDNVRKSDYDPDGKIFTGHSARVGSVVDAYQSRKELGIEDSDLMKMGDWTRIDMVLHYTRHLRVEHDGNIKSQHLIKL